LADFVAMRASSAMPASRAACRLGIIAAATWTSAAFTRESCIAKFMNITKDPLRSAALEQMVIASGKDIPYDSGKYSVCENIEIAVNVPTKFFIVKYALKQGKNVLPGEVGLCLPAECKDTDIDSVREFIGMMNSTLATFANSINLPEDGYLNPFNNKDDRLSWGKGTTIAICIVCLMFIIVAFSTFVVSRAMRAVPGSQQTDGVLLSEQSQPPGNYQLRRKFKLCEAFSLVGPSGTWNALWKVDSSRPTDCLNGMRVLSMFFIVMGHGLHEPMDIAGYRNAECILKTPFCLDAANTNMWTYLLLAGQLGVDTFFFIAGFLLSFVGRSRSMPIVLGTVLRYARLLPLFAFVMMVYVLISPFLAFGPFSPRMQNGIFSVCNNSTWWSELLFISAFYPWYPEGGGCMGWSWYLGVDMVFAVIGLILLNLWKKCPRLAWASAGIAVVACSAVQIQQSLHYNLDYNVISPSFAIYGKYLYARFYARLPAFLLGLVAPWALDSLERRGLRRGTQPRSLAARLVVIGLSMIALAIAAVCIFLPYTNSSGPGPYSTAWKGHWTPWQSALWITFSRPVWALCWLIWALACYFEYLPLTNAILSHWVLSPLASLTFGAYLWHPVIIKIIAGNLEDYYIYSPLESVQRTVFFFILAYMASVVSWCLVEKPIATISGWLVPKKKSVPRPSAVNSECNAT